MFISLSNPLLRIGFNNEGREVVGDNKEPLREEAEDIRGRFYHNGLLCHSLNMCPWPHRHRRMGAHHALDSREHTMKSCFKDIS